MASPAARNAIRSGASTGNQSCGASRRTKVNATTATNDVRPSASRCDGVLAGVAGAGGAHHATALKLVTLYAIADVCFRCSEGRGNASSLERTAFVPRMRMGSSKIWTSRNPFSLNQRKTSG